MASRELSILVKAAGAIQAARDIGKVDSAVGGLSKTASRGVRTAATNIGRLGLVAAGAVGVAVKGGIESLAQLENATAQVDGAIKQMGLTGQVTSGQVATWANQIESDIGAAFDDKDITSATANLLRFGKLTPQNLRPAMEVMTDLAAKTGDVDSASSLLAKALADPAKAAGKLARVGVVLTKSQQDQIKAMAKAGDAAGAQKVLLDALAETTKGAAAATQGPYQRSLSTLKDVTEDAQRALAEGFLPVIEKVRDFLSKELAKPETLTKIRDFGKGLASGLDSLIELAKNIPWSSIGDAMKLAGQGAKAALDLFTGLPPWVQTAVLTGWGLNKITGGAAGSIIGELGKGLIKGVLGMNAGVVNINAGVVNGAGGGGVAAAARGIPMPVQIVGMAAVVLAALKVGTDISGINAPNHQLTGGATNRFGGTTFRGTNDSSEQIVNLQKAQVELEKRAAAGDAFAARQLAAVKAEMARLTTAAATQTTAVYSSRNAMVAQQQAGTSRIVAALHNLSFNLNLRLAGGGRTTVRVTSGTTLNRTLSYAGKIVPL